MRIRETPRYKQQLAKASDEAKEAAKGIQWLLKQRTVQQLVEDKKAVELGDAPGFYVISNYGGRFVALVCEEGDGCSMHSFAEKE